MQNGSCRELSPAATALQKAELPKRKIRRWRGSYEETCEDQKFRVKPFLKGLREWRGHEPRCPDRIRTPEKPLAGHTARPAFPASGKPRFFIG